MTSVLTPAPQPLHAIEDINKGRLTWWLWEALGAGDMQACRKWIEMGADVNAKSRTGTPVQIAVQAKNVDCMRLLLECGKFAPTGPALDGLLRKAALGGDGPMVDLLLRHGCPLDGKLLKEASEDVKVPSAMVFQLLQHGASYDDVKTSLVGRCAREPFNVDYVNALIARDMELELRQEIWSRPKSDERMTPFKDYFAALDARSKASLLLGEQLTATGAKSTP